MEWIYIAVAYFSGAVPFGLLVAKYLCGTDPRESGSGNVGATNVGRLCGAKYGVLALVFDLLKGAVPVGLLALQTDSALYLSLTAFSALLGHCYSIFLGFKGGKAVATTIGVFIPLAFWQLLASSAVMVAIVYFSGYMSLGSLSLVVLLLILLLSTGKAAFAPLGAAVVVLVFWRHRANIMRLARGEENSLRKKKDSA